VEGGTYTKRDGRKIKVNYQVIEFISGGDLFDYVIKTDQFNEPTCRYFFRKMLSGFHYLHAEVGTTHRDIKLENMMLDRDWVLKLIDLEFTTEVQGSKF
jgi:serine/threonine protein kinase